MLKLWIIITSSVKGFRKLKNTSINFFQLIFKSKSLFCRHQVKVFVSWSPWRPLNKYTWSTAMTIRQGLSAMSKSNQSYKEKFSLTEKQIPKWYRHPTKIAYSTFETNTLPIIANKVRISDAECPRSKG